jgi:hypothetical protein
MISFVVVKENYLYLIKVALIFFYFRSVVVLFEKTVAFFSFF